MVSIGWRTTRRVHLLLMGHSQDFDFYNVMEPFDPLNLVSLTHRKLGNGSSTSCAMKSYLHILAIWVLLVTDIPQVHPFAISTTRSRAGLLLPTTRLLLRAKLSNEEISRYSRQQYVTERSRFTKNSYVSRFIFLRKKRFFR
jgi:hypothetical protein